MSFEMFAGDTKRLHFTLTSGPPSSAPLDIQETTIRWQASKGTLARFSALPVLTKTNGNGLEVTDAFSGALTVELLPADTESLKGTFYHELEVIDASGDVSTAFVGEFVIKPNLIR